VEKHKQIPVRGSAFQIPFRSKFRLYKVINSSGITETYTTNGTMPTEQQTAPAPMPEQTEVNYDELPPRQNNLPLVALALPLCAAQLMGTRHMRGRVQRLLRDPHVWLPWKNRAPWKNNIDAWWHNANPWVVKSPWVNHNPYHPVHGQAKSFWKKSANWQNSQPWQNPAPWKAPKTPSA